jgi:hypothetical protein
MKVYIAGPINGVPDGNRPAFKEAADRVRAAGHEPVNPWDIPPDHDGPCCPGDPPDHDPVGLHAYGCYLRADILQLMWCDAIMLLENWHQSRGASTESHIAWSLGLQVVEF